MRAPPTGLPAAGQRRGAKYRIGYNFRFVQDRWSVWAEYSLEYLC